MSKKLLQTLHSNMEFFSGVEKKIAAVILKDPKAFIALSLTDLSERAEVSQGSIVNFARKFSGGGFPALKLQIASELSDYEPLPFNAVTKEDRPQAVFEKVTDGIEAALKNTAALNDEETFERVVAKILRAKKVEIYGIFRSAVVATDFYYQLIQLGIPATFVSDVLTCAISASMLDQDSLVIAVSSSGRTKDIIDVVQTAKANGVPVVCLTSNPVSPLATLSDDVLIACGGSSVSEAQSEIRFSQMYLTDAICSCLRSKIDEDGEKRYFELRNIITSHSVITEES